MKILYTLKNSEYQNEPCFICGINANIIEWFVYDDKGKEIAQTAFLDKGVTYEELYAAFGLRNTYDRRLKAKDIIKKIWDHHPELGPRPLIDILCEFETDNNYYEEYRDHVGHQLYVYSLGIYIAFNCNDILEAVLADTPTIPDKDKEESFLLCWLITSLIHDIGYGLEAGMMESKIFIDEMNKILKYPLSYTENFADNKFRQESSDKLFDSQILSTGHFKPIRYDSQLGGESDEFFLKLESYAEKTGLSTKKESTSMLKSYWGITENNEHIARAGYLDHGISSGLILLNTWHAYKRYIKELFDKALNEDDTKPIKKSIEHWNQNIDGYADLVQTAASAIALHNINFSEIKKDIEATTDSEPNEKQQIIQNILRRKFTEENIAYDYFEIRLTDTNKLETNKATPIAFLLSLTDQLQIWDRPKFRERRSKDSQCEVVDTDFFLSLEEDGIKLCCLKDEAIKENLKTLKVDLAENLEKDFIDTFISIEEVENDQVDFVFLDDINDEDSDSSSPPASFCSSPLTLSKIESLLNEPLCLELNKCQSNHDQCESKFLALLGFAFMKRSFTNINKYAKFPLLFDKLSSSLFTFRESINPIPPDPSPFLDEKEWKKVKKKLKHIISFFEQPDIIDIKKHIDSIEDFEKIENFKQYSQYQKEDDSKDDLKSELKVIWERCCFFLAYKIPDVDETERNEFAQSLKQIFKIYELSEEYDKSDFENEKEKIRNLFRENNAKVPAYDFEEIFDTFFNHCVTYSSLLEGYLRKYLTETGMTLHNSFKEFNNGSPEDFSTLLIDIIDKLPHNYKRDYYMWAKCE